MITRTSCEPAGVKVATTIDDCRLIELPRIARPEGNITVFENGPEAPFDIKRIYYLYDIPGGAFRGGHAHKELNQMLVSVMGSFDVLLDDGVRKKQVTLNRAYYGLVIPQLIWRELINFSSGGICLSLASIPYCEREYIRDYQEFLDLRSAL